jgi:hypothetical protein
MPITLPPEMHLSRLCWQGAGNALGDGIIAPIVPGCRLAP